ncbi:MAG TPA: acyl-protein synthetase [Polyangiaceae bacterium]|jgi:hypothetical protein
MDRRAESDALHTRARAFVDAFERDAQMPEPFERIARDLADFQARNNAGYARLRDARGEALPAVPTEAFKVARVSTFDEAETPIVFRTSGTTIGARGAHWFRTCETYDAGAVAFGRVALDAREPMPVLVIGPPPADQPDSSLTHMIACFAKSMGLQASVEDTYFLRDGVIDLARLDERVTRLMMGNVRGALVLGTSLAYVHLLEALDDARFRMPDETRVMQTGGFKALGREVDAAKLRRDLARAFCVEPRAIVGEYGMTELSSQFWEMSLGGGAPNVYLEPPWARVVPVDGETLAPVKDGEIGVARIEDLLNVDSAVAIVTADRVRRVGGGFELLGREIGAPPRGCSIATEEMLGP